MTRPGGNGKTMNVESLDPRRALPCACYGVDTSPLILKPLSARSKAPVKALKRGERLGEVGLFLSTCALLLNENHLTLPALTRGSPPSPPQSAAERAPEKCVRAVA